MERNCKYCGQKVIGRSDKKFCSPQCRSAFNNNLNSDAINYVRNINNILRKNRRILKDLNPDGKRMVPKQTLLERGFNFDYHTNIYKTKTGNKYYFCYDHGYLELENNRVALVLKQEYVF